MNSEHEKKDIVLRDIEPLLQRTLGDQLIVESFTTKPLLPPGENYGSIILDVHVVIRRDNESKPEDLYLIAKMPPLSEFQRRIFDSPYTFKKESFMYSDILPAYNKLELECGIKEDELFNVLAKFYGMRLSLDPNGAFDDNAVILLENLKKRGYYTGDRAKGNDMEAATVAIRAMARFHAIGIAMKYKRPDYFEVLKVRSKCVTLHAEEFENWHLMLVKKMEEDEALVPYIDRCTKGLTAKSSEQLWTSPPEEPWSTIIHADFWVNNVMFHRNEDGRVDDVKFVDFQNYLFLSPLRELTFYILSSVNIENDETKIDELFDLYYETFIGVLKRMGCDTEPFSREKFDQQLREDACCEFPHLCFMLKVLTLDIKDVGDFETSKIESLIQNYEGNYMFVERLRKHVLRYINRNWI